MGREGALNQMLIKLQIISEPIPELGFSTLSVRLAMIQLYILFMITPLFFSLAQVDRSAIEAARDLGGNWWQTFREVILPQTMPGIVIGSIFIFVLTMGEYGTVATVGGGNITSVGTLIYSKIGAVQYPQGAASAVLLVARPDGRRLGDHALLEPARGAMTETWQRRRRRAYARRTRSCGASSRSVATGSRWASASTSPSSCSSSTSR